MTWNYRVFRESNGDYIIREVFYDEHGAILGCTDEAVEPFGESLEELTQDIGWFSEALALPVLTLQDIPKTKQRRKPDRREALTHEQLVVKLGLGA